MANLKEENQDQEGFLVSELEKEESSARNLDDSDTSEEQPENEKTNIETADPDVVGEEFGPIKRPPLSKEIGIEDRPYHSSLNISQPLINRKRASNRATLVLIVVLVLILGATFFLLGGKNKVSNLIAKPTPTSAPTSTPAPTEVPKTINKEDWSLEVLNGSGKSGFAKQIADKIKQLGYPVVKVGNAENQNFAKTQILVKKALIDKTDLVIADLKDIIKIASYGGELKDSTASARIIIGKDSI